MNGIGVESALEPIASYESCQETVTSLRQQAIIIDRINIQS